MFVPYQYIKSIQINVLIPQIPLWSSFCNILIQIYLQLLNDFCRYFQINSPKPKIWYALRYPLRALWYTNFAKINKRYVTAIRYPRVRVFSFDMYTYQLQSARNAQTSLKSYLRVCITKSTPKNLWCHQIVFRLDPFSSFLTVAWPQLALCVRAFSVDVCRDHHRSFKCRI